MTMRDGARYRPSGDWSLEARVAPSHATAHVAMPAGLHSTVRGQVTSIIQQGIDTRDEQARLRGSSRSPTIGPSRLVGAINSEFVDVIGFPDRGTLTITAAKHRGSLTLDLTGPHSELAPATPTTTPFTFTVAKATGRFAPYVGGRGAADLTLVTHGPPPFNPSHISTSHGTFTLVLTPA
jgi:hypothetical protein